MVVFLYSDLLYRVLVSHNNKQYMHQPLVSLLRTGKERCDEFVVGRFFSFILKVSTKNISIFKYLRTNSESPSETIRLTKEKKLEFLNI